MTPDQLDAYRARRGWTVYRLAKALRTPEQTVRNWIAGTRVPGTAQLAVCELERRRAERAGLGTCSCPACGAIAVEDDGLDDRYACVLCGERADPDRPTKGHRP